LSFTYGEVLQLVLEFLDSDLEIIIKDRSLVFLPADIKSWMAMTFRGLEFCHRNFILHRDLKPNNLLIASNGQLKLADFGLARDFADPGYKMTCQVITRWYRPPELLFGCRYYSTAVDIWSVGCIFAELMLRTPYLPGETDMDQLKTIFRALGTPTEEDWPGHTKLPDYVPVGQFPRTPLRDLFTAASGDTLNLLSKTLTYEPRKRISAREVGLRLPLPLLSRQLQYAVMHDAHVPISLRNSEPDLMSLAALTGSSPPLLYIPPLSNTSFQTPKTVVFPICPPP